MSALRIRPATLDDIDGLCDLESRAFSSDRISRRSFRALLGRGTAETLIAEDHSEPAIAGYAMILFRNGTGMARLYSLAVDPVRTGKGIGAQLLAAAEEAAFAHDRLFLRLEVREDNKAAIALYAASRYRQIGRVADYYADGCAALRFEKAIRGHAALSGVTPPFYEQSTDFTCGAACLCMAFGHFASGKFLDPVWEVRFWREATTVFMLSGPGGCEPYGLAVVAADHGLRAEIWCSVRHYLFLETVRDPEKRRVMELAQRDFRNRAKAAGIVAHQATLSLAAVRRHLAAGRVALVLVSGYLMMGSKVPHWVLAHADDGRHIILHDPWVEAERGETPADVTNMPVPYAIFERISRFGTSGLRATVILEGTTADV
ncbi:GNAT family N-acetyltransferase/peptidase C39 family protein [Pseudohoeflea coraliihabitans]|uniref:GNAT family N-acetyltransferase/peptidase C39 family protein n=1 Tax=Pseudohoeflea coraliihabitans TaxID=2860393 RepID=A0ABS6WNX1_9HYPH|nr:GNAT family N-acetyltransferase/peptidase C39 family protein [Pseudohoeflea sp. DP4N28-3]MBW3097666.1 GNAT family N-acetyltransferase/peptidase C39 family protein [Pseudohoeflea sp. DP4N28-3]